MPISGFRNSVMFFMLAEIIERIVRESESQILDGIQHSLRERFFKIGLSGHWAREIVLG